MSLTECLLPLRAISCRSFSFAEVVAACSQIEFHGLRIAQRTYSNILNMGLAEACKSGEWTRYVDMLNTEVVLGVAAREVSIMKLQNANASELQQSRASSKQCSTSSAPQEMASERGCWPFRRPIAHVHVESFAKFLGTMLIQFAPLLNRVAFIIVDSSSLSSSSCLLSSSSPSSSPSPSLGHPSP